MCRYTIISPVRNEEEYIAGTIESVIKQKLTPHEWIIVNDGSTDDTAKIASEYAKKHDWIKVVHQEDRGFYFPGTGVVNTFYTGFDAISKKDWDFVVKLDCDLSFDEEYFSNVLNEFKTNPKLGIASGLTWIPKNGGMIAEKLPEDHPVGPSKIYKRECFEAINGLKPIPGWDLADLLAAQMNGWETKVFEDYRVNHYRVTGARRKGFAGAKFLLGRFQYRFGYSFLYTVFKSFYRMFEKPVIIGSIVFFSGYMYAFFTNEKRLFEKPMRKYLRQRQWHYLGQKIKGIFQS